MLNMYQNTACSAWVSVVSGMVPCSEACMFELISASFRTAVVKAQRWVIEIGQWPYINENKLSLTEEVNVMGNPLQNNFSHAIIHFIFWTFFFCLYRSLFFPIFLLLCLSYQALIPLCEDDNQSMEIIQRLQKNLDILIQSMARVSSRSEMLGAIHQVCIRELTWVPAVWADSFLFLAMKPTKRIVRPCD